MHAPQHECQNTAPPGNPPYHHINPHPFPSSSPYSLIRRENTSQVRARPEPLERLRRTQRDQRRRRNGDFRECNHVKRFKTVISASASAETSIPMPLGASSSYIVIAHSKPRPSHVPHPSHVFPPPILASPKKKNPHSCSEHITQSRTHPSRSHCIPRSPAACLLVLRGLASPGQETPKTPQDTPKTAEPAALSGRWGIMEGARGTLPSRRGRCVLGCLPFRGAGVAVGTSRGDSFSLDIFQGSMEERWRKVRGEGF